METILLRMVVSAAEMELRSEQLNLLASDAVPLALQMFGRAEGTTLLFTHGFGQTGAAWDAAARHLASAGFRGVTLDARGHGNSGWSDNGHYHLDYFVDDLVRVAQYCGPDTVLVGASMGGLVGMLAQAERGPLFRALVLVDITPRWESAGVERILAFMRAYPDGFASLDDAADAISAYLPQRRERKTPKQLRALLRQGSNGRWHWHWDPRLLDAVTDQGAQYQQRLLTAAASVQVPLLLLSGSDSDVVSQSTIDEFLALAPHARHEVVPRATHMVVGDRNDAFTTSVLNFLRTPGRPRS
jgi:pimeloyl-ACP methyl ester carboxylesterase